MIGDDAWFHSLLSVLYFFLGAGVGDAVKSFFERRVGITPGPVGSFSIK
jgi:hypothetical protein